MVTYLIEMNTKLAAMYYKRGKPICLESKLVTPCLIWRIDCIKLLVISTTKTQEG